MIMISTNNPIIVNRVVLFTYIAYRVRIALTWCNRYFDVKRQGNVYVLHKTDHVQENICI